MLLPIYEPIEKYLAPLRSPLLESCLCVARIWLRQEVSRRCYGNVVLAHSPYPMGPRAYPSHNGDPWQQLWCHEVVSLDGDQVLVEGHATCLNVADVEP